MNASNRSETESRAHSDVADESDTEISVHRPTSEKTVFTEEGNTDGWIATDLTVTPEP